MGNPEQDPDRVFLSVEASRISVIYLRQAFDLLGKANERLPATFYIMLMSGVSGRIHCYDEQEAARYLEYRLEDYEAAGEKSLEEPQSLEETKGPWLSKSLKPFAEGPGDHSSPSTLEAAQSCLSYPGAANLIAPTGGFWKSICLAELVHSAVHDPRVS